MKQRILSMLLAAAMMLSLVSCGGSETPPAVSTPPAQSTPAQSTPDESSPDKSASVDTPEPPPVDSGYSTVEVDGLQLPVGLMEEEEAAAQLDENPDRDIDRAVEPIKPVFGTMLDGTPLTDEFYYYRETLDSTLKQAYDLIRAGLLEGKERIQMTVPVPQDQFSDLYKKIIYDSPELFWLELNGTRYAYNNKGLVTYVLPAYNDLAESREGNAAIMEEFVAEALADMWSLSTDVEKAKYAHDYLTSTIEYEIDSPYNQTSFSALVNQVTVCAGYAHAFQYMMQKMGIPCAYVVGFAMGGRHAWNILELDGEHYAMDVTWDDPLGAKPGRFYYNYFNITDAEIEADHLRESLSALLPVAEGTACNFQNAFGGNAYGTDFDAIVGEMPKPITDGDSGDSSAEDNPYLS